MNINDVQTGDPEQNIQFMKNRFVYFFREDINKTTPPIPITAMPTIGDQLRWCGLFAMILISPIFAMLSLVKKVTAVNMVNNKPRIIIKIPAFFIINVFS
jgi:hypothetical protein